MYFDILTRLFVAYQCVTDVDRISFSNEARYKFLIRHTMYYTVSQKKN